MSQSLNSETLVGSLGNDVRKRNRLLFIEFRALFLGSVSRADLVDALGISPAVATREISSYIEQSGGQIALDGTTKTYKPRSSFRPMFEHPMERVLIALSQGFGQNQDQDVQSLIPSAIPSPLSLPSWKVLAPITRAIHQKSVVSVQYHSYSSGRTKRDLVPHALVNNGSRWHVRAYDRRRGAFNDFVLTRMGVVEEQVKSAIAPDEVPDKDDQWSRIVELELVPHPAQQRQEITEMDFGMSGGVLIIKQRAALAGYLLRQWNVDCSPDHSEKIPDLQKGEEIRLWLRNPLALYRVSSALMAPGYILEN